MSRTISTSYNSGITLTSQSDNPVTVTSSGTVNASGGYGAIYGEGGGTWTITNSGHLLATSSSNGVVLGSIRGPVTNGVVINQANATISAAGSYYYAVEIYGPATITNASGATISGMGYDAVKLSYNYSGPTDSVTNYGVITNTGSKGIVGLNSLSVVNGAGGTISGSAVGIELHASSTVTNAGTISGGTYAVNFTESQAGNRIIVDPGAVFVGKVTDGYGVLELAAGSGSPGTLGTFGATGITQMGTLQFDPSAKWTVIGNASSNGLGTAPIVGFTGNDTIDLTGFVAVSHTFASNALVLTNALNSHATLHIRGSFTTGDFLVTPTATDLIVTDISCYAAGTRIRTTRGEIAVERLREGDLALTISGRAQPIRWIGRRHVDFRRHPNRQRILPVRIAAHAFGQGLPRRALLLSPDHAVFVEDVLIPIRHLVNGTTVAQIERTTITYYHVELPRHDVLLAEGMPAESYLEAGTRDAFANSAGAIQLHPDFARPQDHFAMLWESEGYAPLVVAGAMLDRARDRLARQARPLTAWPVSRDVSRPHTVPLAA